MNEEEVKKKNKNVWKWGLLCLATPWILFLLLLTLLYIPGIQNWAVKQAAQMVSNATGMNASVGNVNLTFPLDLTLNNVTLHHQKDTLAYLGRLRTEVAFWPLLKSQVRVTGIEIDRLEAHTDTLIPALNINGEVEKLYLSTANMNWADGNVKVQMLHLTDADVEITIHPDNTPKDTSATNIPWHFLLQQAKLNDIHLQLNIPADTLSITLGWENTTIEKADINLSTPSYGVDRWQMTDGSLSYNRGKSTTPATFNPNHIGINDLCFHFDSLLYSQNRTNAIIHQLTFNEHSGFTLREMAGSAYMDTIGINLPNLHIALAQSHLKANAQIQWNALLKSDEKGEMKANLNGAFYKRDAQPFLSTVLSDTLLTSLPDTPLKMNVQIQGNINNQLQSHFLMEMDSIITLEGNGHVSHLTDSLKRKGEANITLNTYNLDFLYPPSDTVKINSFTIPHNLKANLLAGVNGDNFHTQANVNGSCGTLTLDAGLNPSEERYRLRVMTDSLGIHHFLPNNSLKHLTADIRMAGLGFDPYATQTRLFGKAEIHHLGYGKANLDSIMLNAKLDNHQYEISLTGNNSVVKTQSHVDGIIRKDTLTAKLTMDVPVIDFQTLQLNEKPLTASFHLQAEGQTDWKEAYNLKTDLTQLQIDSDGQTHKTKDLHVEAYTHPAATYAHTTAGDLTMTLRAEEGLNKLMEQLSGFTEMLDKQLKARKPDINEIKELLPSMNLAFKAGEDNPICNYLHYTEGIQFKDLGLDLTLSPQNGIHTDSYLQRFRTDSLEFDTIRLSISQDSTAIRYNFTVSNSPNPQKPVFTAFLNGNITSKQTDALLRFYDAQNRLGLELGANAALDSSGISLSLFPEKPTVAFRPFALNENNYVMLNDSGRITANIALIDSNGTGVRFYSSPNEEATQDLTLDLAKIRMEEILKILPYAPDLSGILDAELHYVNTSANNTFSGTLQVEDFIYEQYPIGTLGMEAVYLPTSQKQHLVALQLLHNDEEIATVQGSYADDTSDNGIIDGELHLNNFPLNPVNAFLPRETVTMNGMLNGEISLNGAIQSPHINGELRFDSVKIHSPLYALDFRFDQTPLLINDNRLLFDQFNIYARGKNPFTLNGNIDISEPAHMKADLRMRAVEYELLNAKESKNSLLYGKVFVSLFSTIKGELDELVVRGTMNVLGKTDVTYILKDSPLTVEDRLGSMVTFINFNDTLSHTQSKNEVSFGSMDLLMNVQIDQGAQAKVELGNDNYVEVEGGGNLSLQYTPQGELLLTGRYTLNQGEMKYSLPVIPLKTFNIQNGSYVEFTGDPANPFLNVTATERVRTSVTEDKVSRYVNFDVGVSITNNLDQMGLEFTLEAPEDVALQNQLAAMSAEERGKLAVTMLVTGMYIGNQGSASGGFSTNNALNSFLQNEISNIAGSALKTVDVSIGVEDNYATDGSAEGGTDYSFRFAKRFWNNRLSVIIGGRISTGNEAATEKNSSFIDDISLEWRLDDSGTRYVKLFHARNYESILEGEIIETGVGLVLRKKVNKLGELFIFRRNKQQKQLMPTTYLRKNNASKEAVTTPSQTLSHKEER